MAIIPKPSPLKSEDCFGSAVFVGFRVHGPEGDTSGPGCCFPLLDRFRAWALAASSQALAL